MEVEHKQVLKILIPRKKETLRQSIVNNLRVKSSWVHYICKVSSHRGQPLSVKTEFETVQQNTVKIIKK